MTGLGIRLPRNWDKSHRNNWRPAKTNQILIHPPRENHPMSRLSSAQMPHQLGNRRCGFTLVELLVVIAIVSLLIAILLPTMAAARQTSRRVACQSNLRQIATAYNAYLDQCDGYFLQMTNANLNFGGKQGSGS